MVRICLLVWLCCSWSLSWSQDFGVPNYWPENTVNDSTAIWGTSFSFTIPEKTSSENSTWFKRKLLQEHFVTISDSAIFLFIDPMLNVHRGGSIANENTYLYNGRGIRAGFVIQDKMSAETWLMENQSSTLPVWQYKQVNAQTVVYSKGRSKVGKENTNFDFAWAMARMQMKLHTHVKTEIGYGRQHLGKGYRSLILGRQTVPFPYLKNILTLGKFTYVYQIASWNTLIRAESTESTEAPFVMQKNKLDELHWQINKNWELSYMSGILWRDDKQYSATQTWSHFEPISGLLNIGNSNLFQLNGMQFGYHKNNFNAYGQVLFGEKKQLNKGAFQLGALKKLNLRNGNVFLRTEYNFVPKHVYDSRDLSWKHQGYYSGHIGGQAREWLNRLQCKMGRIMMEGGVNIDVQNKVLNQANGEVQYVINPQNGLAAFVGINHFFNKAKIQSEINTYQTVIEPITWFNFGLRTSIFRLVPDF